MGFDDFVVDFASIASAFEEPAALHESKVFGGHWGWDLAGLCKLRDGEVLCMEHLEHPESVRVGKDFEALGSLAERFEAGEFEFGGRHVWSLVLSGSGFRCRVCNVELELGGTAEPPLDTSIYRNIANYPAVVEGKKRCIWGHMRDLPGIRGPGAWMNRSLFGLTVLACGLHFRVLGSTLNGAHKAQSNQWPRRLEA